MTMLADIRGAFAAKNRVCGRASATLLWMACVLRQPLSRACSGELGSLTHSQVCLFLFVGCDLACNGAVGTRAWPDLGSRHGGLFQAEH